MSFRTRSPLAAPVAVGLNSTEIVQLRPGASVDPQVVAEIRNGPVTLVPVKFRVALPKFSRVTVCAALVVPAFWLGNVS